MHRALIITYYWPPSGGSGVQRWMYFSKYLKDFDIDPIVITVDEKKASYRHLDYSFNEKVSDVEVYKTNTREPLKLYSRLISGNAQTAIPIGFSGESKPSIFQKISRVIRGNLFIPDSRAGWSSFAYKKAKEIISKEKISIIITTGPPHSTHLVGLRLRKEFNIKWLADFRDPWTDLYYNKFLYRTRFAKAKDRKLEQKVLRGADLVLTVGPSMRQHLIQKGSIDPNKVFFIYNGFDENDYKNIECTLDSAYFTISHIGVLTPSQPITALLVAIKHFFNKNHPICKRLRFRLIGNVSDEIINEIKLTIPDLPTENIGYVQKDVATKYMFSSDLLFNSLAEMDNSELLISGKLMEYIASNRPIICLGNPNGDAANLLKEFKYSEVFDRKKPELIVAFLEEIFHNWMNQVALNDKGEKYRIYSRYETTRQLAELIKQNV